MSKAMNGESLINYYCLKKRTLYYLNMEDFTDVDYIHPKRVCKKFEIKNLWKYHDLYL